MMKCPDCGASEGQRHDPSCSVLKERIAKTLSWVDDLPTLRITAREFMDLGEYSCSVPTGVTIGKRWRALLGSHDLAWCRLGGKPRWVIREYVAADDPKMADTKQYRPIIVVKAALSA